MFSPPDSILNQLRTAASGVRGDVAEMVAARCELARLELADSQRRIARLAARLAVCVTFVAIAASTLVDVAVIRWHDEIGDGWLCAAGGLVMVAAVFVGVITYRRFRREFTPFNESLAELREDAVWLEEWIGAGRKG